MNIKPFTTKAVLSPRIAARISPRGFSWLRIAYAFLAFLIFLTALFWAYQALEIERI